MDDVGPLAPGDELSCGVSREAAVDYIKNFIEMSGGAEARQLLCQAAAVGLGGGEVDAAEEKEVVFKESSLSSMFKELTNKSLSILPRIEIFEYLLNIGLQNRKI